jgi:hypothetical protein
VWLHSRASLSAAYLGFAIAATAGFTAAVVATLVRLRRTGGRALGGQPRWTGLIFPQLVIAATAIQLVALA